MEHSFVSALLLMFLMADPLGNIPIFISSLKSVQENRRSKVVIRECFIAAVILCIFALYAISAAMTGTRILKGLKSGSLIKATKFL